MQYEIPKPPKPEVEYRTRRDLRREIERLFADEEITAGLNAACAEKILAWAEEKIEAAYHQPNRFSEVACAIREHAGKVGQIAKMIADGTDTNLLRERLIEPFPTLGTDDLFADVEEAIEIMLAQFDELQ